LRRTLFTGDDDSVDGNNRYRSYPNTNNDKNNSHRNQHKNTPHNKHQDRAPANNAHQDRLRTHNHHNNHKPPHQEDNHNSSNHNGYNSRPPNSRISSNREHSTTYDNKNVKHNQHRTNYNSLTNTDSHAIAPNKFYNTKNIPHQTNNTGSNLKRSFQNTEPKSEQFNTNNKLKQSTKTYDQHPETTHGTWVAEPHKQDRAPNTQVIRQPRNTDIRPGLDLQAADRLISHQLNNNTRSPNHGTSPDCNIRPPHKNNGRIVTDNSSNKKAQTVNTNDNMTMHSNSRKAQEQSDKNTYSYDNNHHWEPQHIKTEPGTEQTNKKTTPRQLAANYFELSTETTNPQATRSQQPVNKEGRSNETAIELISQSPPALQHTEQLKQRHRELPLLISAKQREINATLTGAQPMATTFNTNYQADSSNNTTTNHNIHTTGSDKPIRPLPMLIRINPQAFPTNDASNQLDINNKNFNNASSAFTPLLNNLRDARNRIDNTKKNTTVTANPQLRNVTFNNEPVIHKSTLEIINNETMPMDDTADDSSAYDDDNTFTTVRHPNDVSSSITEFTLFNFNNSDPQLDILSGESDSVSIEDITTSDFDRFCNNSRTEHTITPPILTTWSPVPTAAIDPELVNDDNELSTLVGDNDSSKMDLIDPQNDSTSTINLTTPSPRASTPFNICALQDNNGALTIANMLQLANCKRTPLSGKKLDLLDAIILALLENTTQFTKEQLHFDIVQFMNNNKYAICNDLQLNLLVPYNLENLLVVLSNHPYKTCLDRFITQLISNELNLITTVFTELEDGNGYMETFQGFSHSDYSEFKCALANTFNYNHYYEQKTVLLLYNKHKAKYQVLTSDNFKVLGTFKHSYFTGNYDFDNVFNPWTGGMTPHICFRDPELNNTVDHTFIQTPICFVGDVASEIIQGYNLIMEPGLEGAGSLCYALERTFHNNITVILAHISLLKTRHKDLYNNQILTLKTFTNLLVTLKHFIEEFRAFIYSELVVGILDWGYETWDAFVNDLDDCDNLDSFKQVYDPLITLCFAQMISHQICIITTNRPHPTVSVFTPTRFPQPKPEPSKDNRASNNNYVNNNNHSNINNSNSNIVFPQLLVLRNTEAPLYSALTLTKDNWTYPATNLCIANSPKNFDTAQYNSTIHCASPQIWEMSKSLQVDGVPYFSKYKNKNRFQVIPQTPLNPNKYARKSTEEPITSTFTPYDNSNNTSLNSLSSTTYSDTSIIRQLVQNSTLDESTTRITERNNNTHNTPLSKTVTVATSLITNTIPGNDSTNIGNHDNTTPASDNTINNTSSKKRMRNTTTETLIKPLDNGTVGTTEASLGDRTSSLSQSPATSVSTLSAAELSRIFNAPGTSPSMIAKFNEVGLKQLPNDQMDFPQFSVINAVKVAFSILQQNYDVEKPNQLQGMNFTTHNIVKEIITIVTDNAHCSWDELLFNDTLNITWSELLFCLTNNTQHNSLSYGNKILLAILAYLLNVTIYLIHDTQPMAKSIVGPSFLSRFLNGGYSTTTGNTPILHLVEDNQTKVLSPLMCTPSYKGCIQPLEARDFMFQTFNFILASNNIIMKTSPETDCQYHFLDTLVLSLKQFADSSDCSTCPFFSEFSASDISRENLYDFIICFLIDNDFKYESLFYSHFQLSSRTFNQWRNDIMTNKNPHDELFIHLTAHCLMCNIQIIPSFLGDPNSNGNIIQTYQPLIVDNDNNEQHAVKLETPKFTLTVVQAVNKFYLTSPASTLLRQDPPREFLQNRKYLHPGLTADNIVWAIPRNSALEWQETNPLLTRKPITNKLPNSEGTWHKSSYIKTISYTDMCNFITSSSKLRGHPSLRDLPTTTLQKCNVTICVTTLFLHNLNLPRGEDLTYPKTPEMFFRSLNASKGPINLELDTNYQYDQNHFLAYKTALTIFALRDKLILSIMRHLSDLIIKILNYDLCNASPFITAELLSPYIYHDYPKLFNTIIDIDRVIVNESMNFNHISSGQIIKQHTTKIVNLLRHLFDLYKQSRFHCLSVTTVTHFCYVCFIACYPTIDLQQGLLYDKVIQAAHYVSNRLNNNILTELEDNRLTGFTEIDDTVFRVSTDCLPPCGHSWSRQFQQHKNVIAHDSNYCKRQYEQLYPMQYNLN
jgi:hypothetical protein